MNDIRYAARIIAMATCLARRPNRPTWVKPYDNTAALLTVRRYCDRASRWINDGTPTTAYQQYIRSRDWFDFRLAIMVLAGGACAECGEPADEVHHLHYRTKGNESPCDVVPLCRSCHSDKHPNAMTFQIK